jgi:hypothetical protein
MEFRQLVDFTQAIAKKGSSSQPTTERAYYAHCLLVKASLHARSMVSLFDSASGKKELYDVGALCVLARCLIEVRHAAAYLLESNISKEEAHLRLNLVGLNGAVDLLRVSKGLNTSSDDFLSEHSIRYFRNEISSNSIFLSLDDAQKKMLMIGKWPFQRKRYHGARPLKFTQESAIYTLLSHSAHAFSLGLSGYAGYGSATPAGTVNSFMIAMLTSQIYLADLVKTYCKFRRRSIGKLSLDDSDLLDRCSSVSELNLQLDQIRASNIM